jgi:hypothetical protein
VIVHHEGHLSADPNRNQQTIDRRHLAGRAKAGEEQYMPRAIFVSLTNLYGEHA